MNQKKSGFIFHIHPEQVPAGVLRFQHTYGLGGMALVLFLLQVITGVLLTFAYDPSPVKAYDSILTLEQGILFGGFIRNIHHLSGTLLIFVSLFHLLRVLFTGAFYGVRSSNWVIGIVLLMIILFSNFTGYLLPWDQLSYWAVTVALQMLGYIPLIGHELAKLVRGGDEVGASTLITFYDLHTAVLPFTLFILLLFHFWKVRRAGGVISPGKKIGGYNRMVPVVPNLVVRELATGLILLAVVFSVALILDAPLREAANPAFSPDPSKAPWFFLGIQELILHFHPLFSVVLIPLLFLFLLFGLPYFFPKQQGTGSYNSSGNDRKVLWVSAGISLIIHPLLIIFSEYFFHPHTWFPGWPPVISEGIFPFILYALIFLGYLFYLIRKFHPSGLQRLQSVVIYFLIAYTVLSCIAIFFRGPGMKLVWPWGMN